MARRGRELDQERAELERALDAGASLDQASADALNARRASYNSNAMVANEEIGRHQNALAVLNREIERYNLMLKYPDGLDEAAMFTPAPLNGH
jgi:chromosome segregation ATPase